MALRSKLFFVAGALVVLINSIYHSFYYESKERELEDYFVKTNFVNITGLFLMIIYFVMNQIDTVKKS